MITAFVLYSVLTVANLCHSHFQKEEVQAGSNGSTERVLISEI